MELSENLILTEIGAQDKFEALDLMARRLHELGCVKKSFFAAVAEREKDFATGLALGKYNVAIPHADAAHVNRPAVCVGILSKEVKFGAMGDDEREIPVKLIFMLAVKEPHAQLEVLQKLTAFFQHGPHLESLCKEKNKAAILRFLLKQMDCFSLPEHEGNEPTRVSPHS